MRCCAGRGHDIEDWKAPRDHCVRDEPPMTPPWERLRAHHNYSFFLSEENKTLQALFEFFRFHVIGVTPESSDAPTQVL